LGNLDQWTEGVSSKPHLKCLKCIWCGVCGRCWYVWRIDSAHVLPSHAFALALSQTLYRSEFRELRGSRPDAFQLYWLLPCRVSAITLHSLLFCSLLLKHAVVRCALYSLDFTQPSPFAPRISGSLISTHLTKPSITPCRPHVPPPGPPTPAALHRHRHLLISTALMRHAHGASYDTVRYYVASVSDLSSSCIHTLPLYRHYICTPVSHFIRTRGCAALLHSRAL
jgi:hypothetical protein